MPRSTKGLKRACKTSIQVKSFEINDGIGKVPKRNSTGTSAASADITLSTPVSEKLQTEENANCVKENSDMNYNKGEVPNDTELKKETILTSTEKARCERNRQKALLLRQARLSNQQIHGNVTKTIGFSRLIDTEGGFLLEENDNKEPKKVRRVEEEAPVIAGELLICLDCDTPFLDSYLLSTYDHAVCDKCKDIQEKHSVITKTEARESYLLSEADLNVREPILKFVVKKNPRNNRWGDMKLYLRLQVEQRALEIWGTPEALEEERELREKKKEDAKRKRFAKKLKTLRQEVRSSLYQVTTVAHQHEYGPETECEGEEDTWKKVCSACGHKMIFEKM